MVPSPGFIGRRDELASLIGLRSALSKTRGHAVLVEGDAGIGKTRLLQRFEASATSTRERRSLTAECLEWGQAPLAPIRTFTTALLAKIDLTGAPAHAVAAAQRLTANDGDAPPLEKGDLFAGLASFFEFAAYRRATVFTIEDIHWSDRSTLEFLTYWVPRLAVSRQLVIATYRSDRLAERGPLFDVVSRLSSEPHVVRLTLEALAPAEISELIDATLEGSHASLHADARREIERRSEGNPFFAEELVKAALESDEAEAALPLSIRASVLERTRLLDESERRVIAHAAVLGPRVDFGLLATVVEQPVDDVLPALRRARELGILIDDRRARGTLRFRHALTQRTIYDEMPAFDARRLHERIVAALEVEPESERVDDLAHHAWSAGDPVKALRYNERAGERAVTLSAFAEAEAYFERALEFARAPEDRARLLERTGFAAEQRGDVKRGLASYERAHDIHVSGERFDDAARVMVWIVAARSNLGDAHAAHDAEAFADRHGSRITATFRDRLYALSARIFSALYEFDATRRALAKIENSEHLEPVARQNALIAALNEASADGDGDAWGNAAAELFAVASQLRPFLAAIAYFTIAQTGAPLGANDVVERALERAGALVREHDFGALRTFGAAVRARWLFLRGRVRESRDALLEALESDAVFVARFLAATVGVSVAEACAEPELAERALPAELLASAREGAIYAEDALVLTQHAERLAAAGKLEGAREALAAALASPHLAHAQTGPVLVAAAQHLDAAHLAPLFAMFEDAAASARVAPPNRRVALRAALALAEAIAVARGLRRSPRGAAALALSAASLYRRLAWPLFEARALEVAGRLDAARELREGCGVVQARPAAGAGFSDLTERERRIGELVCDGLTNAAIAERLAVSPKTIEKQLSRLLEKLGARTRAQVAAAFATERVAQ